MNVSLMKISMNSTNLSPLENLRRRKVRLSIKSDALVDALEDNFAYLQENIVPLVSKTAMEAVSSKMPPFVQHLIGRKKEREESFCTSSKFSGIAESAINLIPFFLKGGKGLILTFLLSQLKKRLFK